MNNAVHWAAVEQALPRAEGVVEGRWTVEVEYRVPLEADDEPELAVVRTDDGFGVLARVRRRDPSVRRGATGPCVDCTVWVRHSSSSQAAGAW